MSNNAIRKVSSAGSVATLAGSVVSGWVDGSFATAKFYRPQGICVDTLSVLYVSEIGAIRMLLTTGMGVGLLNGVVRFDGCLLQDML